MSEQNPHTWFEGAVTELLPRLYGMARRLTRNDADAEDLVADALAKAWDRLDSLTDQGAFGGWMCRILTTTFISQRRGARAQVITEPYLEESEEEGQTFSLFERLHQPFLLWQGNPETAFLNRLLREDLTRAIDTLPEAFRVVVLLVEVQGFAYQEVTDALDVPIGTVRSRLARGRSLLQKELWTQALDEGIRSPEAPAKEPEKTPAETPQGAAEAQRGIDHE